MYNFDGHILSRAEMAVMLVLYEYYPLALTESDIESIIIENRLLEMNEEEFQLYWKNLVQTKEIIRKGQLN